MPQNLEYYPILQYIKEARSVVTASGQQVQVDQLPGDLQDLLTLTGAEVMQSITNVSQQADSLWTKISSALTDDVANGVSFQEYINARTNGDINTILAYESAHAGIDGKTEAEAAPIVMDARAELGFLRDLANDRLFQGLADPNDLAETKERELKQINSLVTAFLNGQDLPLDNLRMDNHFRDVIFSRTQTISNLLTYTSKVLDATLEKDAKGSLPELVQTALDSSSFIDDLKDLNVLHFQGTASDFEDAKMKTERLTPLSMRTGIIQQLDTLQRTLKKYQGVRQMLEGFDSSSGQHPAVTLMTNASSGLERLYQQYAMLLEDVRKVDILHQLNNDGMMQTLDGKRNARAIHRFLNIVKENMYASNHSQALVNHLVRMIKQNS